MSPDGGLHSATSLFSIFLSQAVLF
eukprot:COSAG03_NODE_19827_length_329_cov_0.852174_1_plen_24_part_10